MSAVFVVPLSLVPTVIDFCHVAVGLMTVVSLELNLIISSSVTAKALLYSCLDMITNKKLLIKR